VGLDVKVDELLANIRRNVDADLDSLSPSDANTARGAQMREALRDMRKTMAETPPLPVETKSRDVQQGMADLRSRIRAKMAALEQERIAAPESVARAVVPVRNDFSGILGGPQDGPLLRGGYGAESGADDLRYAPDGDSYHDYDTGRGGERLPPQQAYADPAYDRGFGFDHSDAGYGYAEPNQQHLMSPQAEAQAESAFRQLSDAILAKATGDRSLEDMTREMLRTMLKQWLDANLPGIVEDMVREEIQRVARRGR
jgi:cell pole-organizing protein PopZ